MLPEKMGQAAKLALKNEKRTSLSSLSLLEHQQHEVSGTMGVLAQQTTMLPSQKPFHSPLLALHSSKVLTTQLIQSWVFWQKQFLQLQLCHRLWT